jgi:hypothetical protein
MCARPRHRNTSGRKLAVSGRSETARRRHDGRHVVYSRRMSLCRRQCPGVTFVVTDRTDQMKFSAPERGPQRAAKSQWWCEMIATGVTTPHLRPFRTRQFPELDFRHIIFSSMVLLIQIGIELARWRASERRRAPSFVVCLQETPEEDEEHRTKVGGPWRPGCLQTRRQLASGLQAEVRSFMAARRAVQFLVAKQKRTSFSHAHCTRAHVCVCVCVCVCVRACASRLPIPVAFWRSADSIEASAKKLAAATIARWVHSIARPPAVASSGTADFPFCCDVTTTLLLLLLPPPPSPPPRRRRPRKRTSNDDAMRTGTKRSFGRNDSFTRPWNGRRQPSGSLSVLLCHIHRHDPERRPFGTERLRHLSALLPLAGGIRAIGTRIHASVCYTDVSGGLNHLPPGDGSWCNSLKV